jgi:hypothetical protein
VVAGTRKVVYCENCGTINRWSSTEATEAQPDEFNQYPWYDITCGICCSIIASVRIVPDDEPIKPPSGAIELKPYRVK